MSCPGSRSAAAHTLLRAFGFTRLIVELDAFSALAFGLALFIAAIVQAYHTLGDAFRHLGEPETTKHLLVAAVEQADTLLVGVALLIIGLGLQGLFVGRLQNVPEWLHTALAVGVYSAAQGDTDVDAHP